MSREWCTLLRTPRFVSYGHLPVAKPTSSGTGGFIPFLLLRALLGSAHYLLTPRDARLHPTPEQVAQAARVKADAATAKREAANPKKKPAAPPPGQPVELDPFSGTGRQPCFRVSRGGWY